MRGSRAEWWVVALALAVGCGQSTSTAVADPDGTADAAADVAAADASGDAGGCTCASIGACCDGCLAKAQGKKCTPDGGLWGTCDAGGCVAVPGTVAEWQLNGTGGVTALDVDNVHLAVGLGSADGLAGSTELWNLAAHTRAWSHDGYTQGVALLPGEATVVLLGTTPALLVSLADGATEAVLDGTSAPVAAAPTGGQIAAATDAQIRLFAPNGVQIGALDHPGPQKARHRSLAYAPDMQRLASATGQNGLGSPHGDIRILDLAAATTPVTLDCSSMGVDFAPDSQKLLAACWNFVRIYDAVSGKVIAQGVDPDTVLSVAWAPDGKRFVVGTLTGGAKLYAVAASQSAIAHPVATLPVPQVAALAFSPDGTRVYVGNGLKPIVLQWQLPAL